MWYFFGEADRVHQQSPMRELLMVLWAVKKVIHAPQDTHTQCWRPNAWNLYVKTYHWTHLHFPVRKVRFHGGCTHVQELQLLDWQPPISPICKWLHWSKRMKRLFKGHIITFPVLYECTKMLLCVFLKTGKKYIMQTWPCKRQAILNFTCFFPVSPAYQEGFVSSPFLLPMFTAH